MLVKTAKQFLSPLCKYIKLRFNMSGCGILNSVRVGLIQMAVGSSKCENIKRAETLIAEAKQCGCSMVVLPECFNSPYGTKYFREYAESIPCGETSKALSNAAKCNKVILVGGSYPEDDEGKLYNTCTVWDTEGNMICKHRKLHLFDIDIPGGITFIESDVLTAGNNLSLFNISNIKAGVGICYDVRFGELASLYRKQSVDVLIYPGAFNMKTGPLHWKLLLRARAVDNQVFVLGVSPAMDTSADYHAWGHSMAVDPWGKVLAQADFKQQLLVVDLDLKEISAARQQIPVFKQRRTDIYDTIPQQKL